MIVSVPISASVSHPDHILRPIRSSKYLFSNANLGKEVFCDLRRSWWPLAHFEICKAMSIKSSSLAYLVIWLCTFCLFNVYLWMFSYIRNIILRSCHWSYFPSIFVFFPCKLYMYRYLYIACHQKKFKKGIKHVPCMPHIFWISFFFISFLTNKYMSSFHYSVHQLSHFLDKSC